MSIRMVALLRGINVGGNKAVNMARLRDLLADLGYSDVRTYLQSGNAIFTCSDNAAATAASDIEEGIEAAFSFSCQVITRSGPELEAAMAKDPLLDLLGDPSRHFVGFLSKKPSRQGVAKLVGDDFGVDQVRVVDKHAYLWCPEGISRSPLGKLNFDRILGVVVTMRNWNTVTKLAAMAGT